MNSFYSPQELKKLGLRSFGREVLISRKVSIYSAEKIIVGNHVRIDDFCILSGSIEIGDFVHIAAYSALFGGKSGISINDFGNISSRVCVYAVSDDYSGETMTNPMVPDKYKNVTDKHVSIGRHCILGSGTTVLPGVEIADGCSIGSMTLINGSTEPWSIYVGIPARKIKERSRNLLLLEKELIAEVKKEV